MSLGFNSDVQVGSDVFHVQTENYGEPQNTIVTLVYHRGRILHRRNSNYADLIAAAGFSEESLNGRVEDQHRSVIEEVRRGAISIPSESGPSNNSGSQGIQVRLRNAGAGAWFSAGQASLDLEVIQRKGNAPVEGAKVEAFLTGPNAGAHCEVETGPDGLARIQFAVANAAANGAELVIRARAGESQATDEIRFSLRPKRPGPAKTPKHSAKQEPK